MSSRNLKGGISENKKFKFVKRLIREGLKEVKFHLITITNKTNQNFFR